MAKPIENNDTAKEFWENLSDAAALDSETKTALTTLIGAETPAGAEAKIAAVLPPTEINPGTITSWVAAGDSITSSATPTATYNSPMWHWIANIISGKEYVWINNGANLAFAASGHRVSNLNATHIPAILALDPRPSHVVCQYGTNDAALNSATSMIHYIAGYRTAIATLRAGGVEPIIMTAPQAQPYNSVSIFAQATTAHRIAAMNEELYALCDELRVRLVDNRFLDNPLAPGETYRGVLLEGELYGIHPQNGWHMAVGQNLAKTLVRYGTGTDAFIYDSVNAEPNFETTIPTFSPGRNLTCSGSLVTRPDAPGGKLLRVEVENNGTKQIGTGDTGILLTPKPGRTVGDFDLSIATESGFNPSGGLPVVAVTPIFGTSRKLILVKPVRPVSTFTSTVQEVIDAINGDPDASALVTASGTGTPGSLVFTSAEMTIPPSNFFSYEPGSTTAAEDAMDDTDQIRAIMEVWIPSGAVPPSLRMAGRADYGAGAFGTLATYQNTTYHSHACPRAGKVVITTPWVTAGSHRRLVAQCFFGGAEGTYEFGRVRIQKRAAP